MSNGSRNEVATIQRIRTLADELKAPAAQERLRDAMLDTMSPERMVGVALTAASRNPMLAQCSTSSIALALMQAGSYGIEPNGRDGHLVPYRNRKTNSVDCQFIPDYKGLIKLALQNPRVRSIAAECVYSNDEFDVSYGSDSHLNHRPCFADRGTFVAVWALAKLANGAEAFRVLSAAEVAKHRSKAQADNVWRDWFDEMACKTAVKTLSKFLPLGGAFEGAVAHDNAIEVESTVVDRSGTAGRRRSARRRSTAEADAAVEALSMPQSFTGEDVPDDAHAARDVPGSSQPRSDAADKPKRKRTPKAGRSQTPDAGESTTPQPDPAPARTMGFSAEQAAEIQQVVDRGELTHDEYVELKRKVQRRFDADETMTVDRALHDLKLLIMAEGDGRPIREDQARAIDSLLDRMGGAEREYRYKCENDYGATPTGLTIAQADHFIATLKASASATGGTEKDLF